VKVIPETCILVDDWNELSRKDLKYKIGKFRQSRGPPDHASLK
jgi:hypothetical protein